MKTNMNAVSLLMTTGVLLLIFTTTTVTHVSASTTIPSSSSEVCMDEVATCYDNSFCWDCVAQIVDISDCEKTYPILADAGASDCEVESAKLCCSLEMSSENCLEDSVTMDYFQCSLEDSGCSLSNSVCFGDGNAVTVDPAPAPTDPPSPAPVSGEKPAAPIDPQTPMPTALLSL